MYYSPHKLQKKTTQPTKDTYGRIVTTAESWTDVCDCRCDDNTIQEFMDDNGRAYRPKYHIVANGYAQVTAGDEIRCLNADGSVRGSGKIYNIKHLNVLEYTDIWV